MNIKYFVRKSRDDTKTQKGAFEILDNAKKCADQNSDYFVWNADGIALYPLPYYIIVDDSIKSLAIFKTSTSGTSIGSTGSGAFTIVEVKNKRGKLKSGVGWVALIGLPVKTIEEDKPIVKKINHLRLSAIGADKTYKAIIDAKCRHSNNPNTNKFSLIAKNHTTSCSRSMSIVLQLAKCLPEGKTISHTKACGLTGDALKRKKSTKASAMTGYKNLIDGTYELYRADCKFEDLPSKYKAKGACYIQDSNCCVSAGKSGEIHYIYSCNESKSQMKNGIYVKNKVTSGYPFKSRILYVILPKKE